MTSTQRLTLMEDLTIYHALEQKAILLDALAAVDELELDLAQIDEIDSAGLQLLILLKQEAQRAERIGASAAGEKPVKSVGQQIDRSADG